MIHITQFSQILGRVRRTLGENTSIAILSVLLAVPDHGMIPMTQLKKLVDIKPSTLSRTLAVLAKHKTRTGRTFDEPLIEIIEDIDDRRHKYIELTHYGRKIKDEIIQA